MDAHGVILPTPWLYRNTTARPQGAARGLTQAYAGLHELLEFDLANHTHIQRGFAWLEARFGNGAVVGHLGSAHHHRRSGWTACIGVTARTFKIDRIEHGVGHVAAHGAGDRSDTLVQVFIRGGDTLIIKQ